MLIGPDPLPVSGYLLRESTDGWQDLQEQAYPTASSTTNSDLPDWPDAVLALDVAPDGSSGWAVGGQTGGIVARSSIGGAQFASQSASALRLGGGVSPPQSAGAPIALPSGQVSFAVGGDAQCAGPCADLANEGIGPDAWLSGALGRAAQIHEAHEEMRAFLYTGAHVAAGAAHALQEGPGGTKVPAAQAAAAYAREQQAYRGDLDAAGALPVYVAPAPSDLDASGSLDTFAAAMGGDAPVGSAPPGTPQPPAGSGAYAIESAGKGGNVRVIVLDFSGSALGAGELEWLEAQLAQAHAAGVPAIVMGGADIAEPSASNYDGQDAPTLSAALLAGRRLRVPVRQPRRKPRRADRLGHRRDPRVRQRHARLRAPARVPRRIPRRQRLPDGERERRRARRRDQPRAGERDARSQHLPARPRCDRRHAAAPQLGLAVSRGSRGGPPGASS